jgi:hypothetical protein
LAGFNKINRPFALRVVQGAELPCPDEVTELFVRFCTEFSTRMLKNVTRDGTLRASHKKKAARKKGGRTEKM